MLRRPLVWVPLVATAILAGGPVLGAWIVRARVLPKVSARIGRAVTAEDVKVGFGSVELRGLIVDGAGDATVDVVLAHGKPVGLPTIDVKNGSLTPVPGLALTGIRASVRPDADGARQVIDVHGSYGGASAELWNAVGWLRADAREG